jgi:ABC-type uncharacterized transport system auxiliary subunit
MSVKAGVLALVSIAVLLLGACALMKTPQPLTTLQLQLPADAQSRHWPARIAPRPTRAAAALQSSRVLVVDGALLMQHAGLRWVDVPAILLDEQLRLLRYAHPGGDEKMLASIELWLTQFNIRIDAAGDRSVEVAALAELKCAQDGSLHRVPVASASVALNSGDAISVAAAFAAATDQVIAAMGAAAARQAEACAAS